MRLIHEHEVKEVSRWSGYHSVSWAYAGDGSNHNVVLPQIFPRFIGAYCAFRRKDLGRGEVQRQRFYLFQIDQGTEIVSDLLTHQAAGREHKHAFRPQQKGGGHQHRCFARASRHGYDGGLFRVEEMG